MAAWLSFTMPAAGDIDRDLIAAAGRGNVAEVRRLLSGGASVRASDERGRTRCSPPPTATTLRSPAR